MAASHTPGPWMADTTSMRDQATVWTVADFESTKDYPHPIAICNDNYEQRRPVAECQANARLIAAAPEMWAALATAREFIRNGVELGFIRLPDEGSLDPAHDTLPAIEAAIRLAETGERS